MHALVARLGVVMAVVFPTAHFSGDWSLSVFGELKKAVASGKDIIDYFNDEKNGVEAR